MPIANGLALPNPLSNGTTGDAVPVMADFNYLLSALNRALLDTGGGAGMNAQNVQLHNLANGTAANDAVNLSQLGGLAALAGAAFTGAVSIASVLGITGALTAAAITASALITGNAGFAGTTLSLSGLATVGGVVATTVAEGAFSSGFSHVRTGAVGFHMYNNGGVVEWGVLQADHGSNDNFRIVTGVSGVFTDRLVISPTGTVTIPGLISGSNGLSINGSLVLTGPLTTGTGANAVGYLGTPQSIHAANYTFALSDTGTDQAFNGTGLTAMIPANASVAFPIGTIIVGTNLNASPLTIAITTDTLIWSGTTTTGSRTIGQNGEFRIRKVAATTWLIAGTAMT